MMRIRMFSRVRRKLRLIRYHSASRPRTAWSTATDVALLSALVIAPLIVWLMNALVVDVNIEQELLGRTMINPSGEVVAQLVTRDGLTSPWPGGMTPISEFRLTKRIEDRGWPVTTTRIVHAPEVDITLIVERTTRHDVAYDQTDAERVAIDMALRYREHDELADGWAEAEDARRTYWLAWVFGSVLACVMLWFVMIIFIGVTRFGWNMYSATRQMRGARLRGQNRCANCGYDLRGLEFNERCPECGHLAW